jgi:pimeloyl-ACP methyl ester carboxylesterase
VDGIYLQIDKMQCLQIGEGKKILFAFHGFGQNPTTFEALRCVLPDYTIYSFDMLSFGKQPKKREVFEQIERFCKSYGIDKFSLLAFSIGAKMALCLVEHFSEKIEKICLVAPDGFKKHFWYNLAVSSIGKPLFWRFIKHPHLFFRWAHYLAYLKILPHQLIKIAEKYTDTPPKRFLLWRTWLAYKNLFPHHPSLHRIFEQKSIPTKIILAYDDHLIPMKSVTTFSDKYSCIQTEQTVYLHHRVLHEAFKQPSFSSFFND